MYQVWVMEICMSFHYIFRIAEQLANARSLCAGHLELQLCFKTMVLH